MEEKIEFLMENSFSKEMRFLFLCSLDNISDETRRKIIESASEIDWHEFSAVLRKHRVTPIVYKNLSSIEGDIIDSNTMEMLENICKKQRIDSLRNGAELVAIAKLMEQNNIRAIALKGAMLGEAIYGDISKRLSRDIDILIDYSDIEKAINLLLNLGYSSEDLANDRSEKQLRNLINKSHHFEFRNNKERVLELHWCYDSGFGKVNFEKLWDERRIELFSGQNINLLSSEEEFLYLMFHGAKHGWARIKWLCDISELFRKNSLDWNQIIKMAKKKKITDILKQSALLSKYIHGVEIPELIEKTVFKKDEKSSLFKMTLPFIASVDDKKIEQGGELYLKFMFYTFLVRKGLKRKIIYIFKLFKPSLNDYNSVKLKDNLHFLYFFMHPYFVIKRRLNKK